MVNLVRIELFCNLPGKCGNGSFGYLSHDAPTFKRDGYGSIFHVLWKSCGFLLPFPNFAITGLLGSLGIAQIFVKLAQAASP